MRLHINASRLLAPRTLRTLRAIAPNAVQDVAEYYGRRPLAPISIVLTNPRNLADEFITTQRRIAKIPADAPTPHRMLESKPRHIRHVTGLEPGRGGGTLTYLNGRRLKTQAALLDAVLFEMCMVNAFLRRGVPEQWTIHLRDLAGVDRLPRHQRAALTRDLDQRERDAAHAVREIHNQRRRRTAA